MSKYEMGESAGRAAHNPVKPDARRRLSPEERAERVHMKDDPQQWSDVKLTRRGERAMGILVVTWMFSVFGMVGAIELDTQTPWTFLVTGGLTLAVWSVRKLLR